MRPQCEVISRHEGARGHMKFRRSLTRSDSKDHIDHNGYHGIDVC